jgi:tellurite resistance protein TerC
MDNLINHPGIIAAFGIVVIFMLLLDLGIFNKKSHVISNKEAAIWSLIWISISMAFSIFIYLMTSASSGVEKLAQFQSAYWIEKALSVDNLFVFILVFGFFNVPREYHHKVLFWGILGALIMRALFIFSGIGLINATDIGPILQGVHSDGAMFMLHIIIAASFIALIVSAFRGNYLWVKILFFITVFTLLITYLGSILKLLGITIPSEHVINKFNLLLVLFGGFLIYAGIKSWFVSDDDDDEKDFSESPGAKFVHRIFKVSKNFDKDKFFTKENGVKMATPLLVVVGVIEFTDLLFAVDSIPAIFAIAPKDPFILYTSNIFAILGLRSLYFLLANFIHMFSRLKYGLAIILSFIGIKMVIAPLYHISSTLSLMIVGGVLAMSMAASIMFPIKDSAVEGN